jgi:hypothetical protein
MDKAKDQDSKKQIIVWTPGLNQIGGIQAFSGFLIEALDQVAPRNLVVFSKQD